MGALVFALLTSFALFVSFALYQIHYLNTEICTLKNEFNQLKEVSNYPK